MPDFAAPRSVDGHTWLIHKQGSNYKAFNGSLGYAPTAGISTSLDTVWTYISDNFELGIVSGDTNGGSVVFGSGKYTFAAAPAPIDDTWTVGDFGIHVRGQGRVGTWVEINASSGAIEAGFEIKDIQYSSIRHLFLRVHDDVANAIKIHATGKDANNNTVEDLLIDNAAGVASASVVQRGIYIFAENSKATFHTTVRDVWMRFIYHGIETAGSSLNNTAHTYTNVDFWLAEKAITVGPDLMLMKISDIGHQCNASDGIYTISLGAGVANSNIRGIWSDGMTKTGSATMILNGRCIRNNIDSVTNNSGTGLIDRSGNIKNNYTNITSFGSPNIHGRAREGRWYAVGAANAEGLLHNIMVSTTAVGGSATHNFDTTNGKCVNYNTTAGAGSQAGIHGNVRVVTRAMAPIFYVRFITSASSDFRLTLALTNDVATPAAIDDDYKDDLACVGLLIQSGAGGNYKAFHNDATGAPVVTDILSTAGAAIPVDASGIPHELWVKGDMTNSSWFLSLDGNTPMEFTTEIPGANDQLTPLILHQWVSGTARVLTVYDIRLSSRT